jgi:hypothetical protein
VDEALATMLAAGGKSNSLGRVDEVIELVLSDQSRLDELYRCLFHPDAWVRMRAADALEKICRDRPDWLLPYVDRFPGELAVSSQPSIQWHLAQMYREVALTKAQQAFAIGWLEQLLSDPGVDWIVAANAMDALVHFVREGAVPSADVVPVLELQRRHKSQAVVKRANKLLTELRAPHSQPNCRDG